MKTLNSRLYQNPGGVPWAWQTLRPTDWQKILCQILGLQWRWTVGLFLAYLVSFLPLQLGLSANSSHSLRFGWEWLRIGVRMVHCWVIMAHYQGGKRLPLYMKWLYVGGPDNLPPCFLPSLPLPGATFHPPAPQPSQTDWHHGGATSLRSKGHRCLPPPTPHSPFCSFWLSSPDSTEFHMLNYDKPPYTTVIHSSLKNT